jgi:DNA-binding NarL/FixJ family response regulator
MDIRKTIKYQVGNVLLSGRELRTVRLVAEGLKNKDIAAQSGTSENTIKNYLRVLFDKTGMSNRTELALWYVAHEEKAR